tara:strand:+ start:128 stop:931 length:804 start_codon:yes stop_codon:yes gene_type:complete
MFGNHFYHKKVRKCVAMFGTLFNNLYVIRLNSSGASTSQIKVPLSYGPKRKFIERINEQADLTTDSKVAIKLPRMSFEITNFSYDANRQLQKIANFNRATPIGDRNSRQKFFVPVPYDIGFELNIYSKNQDDGLQVVEQILPFFNPQYSLTMKPFPTDFPDIKEDIQIILEGLNLSDDYEGSLEQRRTIVYTMSFQMKVNFYGPTQRTDIIRKSISNVFNQGAGSLDSDLSIETITITPNPTNTFGLADSDFGFNESIVINFDSAST